jgi:hypothetical protein
MEIIWKLIDTCITPIITYAAETWAPYKKEMKQINQIMDNIIKRLLIIPTTTPRESLYLELKMLDMEHNIHKTKINMLKRLSQTQNTLISNILNLPKETSWHNQTKILANQYNIDMDKDKYAFKTELKAKIMETFTLKLTQNPKNKSKITFLLKKLGQRRQKHKTTLPKHAKQKTMQHNFQSQNSHVTSKNQLQIQIHEHDMQRLWDKHRNTVPRIKHMPTTTPHRHN